MRAARLKHGLHFKHKAAEWQPSLQQLVSHCLIAFHWYLFIHRSASLNKAVLEFEMPICEQGPQQVFQTCMTCPSTTLGDMEQMGKLCRAPKSNRVIWCICAWWQLNVNFQCINSPRFTLQHSSGGCIINQPALSKYIPYIIRSGNSLVWDLSLRYAAKLKGLFHVHGQSKNKNMQKPQCRVKFNILLSK